MPLNTAHARALLREANFRSLFIEELGWDRYNATLDVHVLGSSITLSAIAEKRGMVAYHCPTPNGQAVPDYGLRRKIERQVAKSALEHLIIFTDPGKTTQIWQWVKREPGKPAACREHTYHHSQSGDALLQKLEGVAFSLDEEERLTLTDVTSAARASFDVERVTKRFYERFKQEHAAFLNFVKGMTDTADREWYASVMLNRLMFVYFIQRKGFLDGDADYLRNRLNQTRKEHGRDKFYSFYRYFLLRLFHEGLGGRERSPALEKLIGRIPYLNGGLFDIHELEQPDRYGRSIEISDTAFERVFDYFDQYQWHLDERPLRDDKEINPDVLGYIFEKYVNQKQMGAYYTKEDITEYIGKNTVIPFLFNAARPKCKIAFENPNGPTVWDLLRADPDRYIFPAVRHGITWRYDPAHIRQGEPLERRLELPPEIVAGLNPAALHQTVGDDPVLTLELRKGWNKPAPTEFALPTETWREVVARRKRHDELCTKLAAGDVRDINDLITLNLDIRQFAQDVIENCEGPELLRAFWHAIEYITILDPTCGSGAFLFAALNILEPLYDACLGRMEAFVEDLERSGDKHRPEKYADFRKVLASVEAHPNRRYFILKSIILRNLYGVDIMEEAVEICKLRLFLKLAAQVEPDANAKNVGIEPLPDIDFNIRAGNTLIGYASYDAVKVAIRGKFDLERDMEKIAIKAADLQQTFDTFRQRQIEGDGSVPAEHKQNLRVRLKALDDELNRHLASEYGIKVRDKDAYAQWLKSHQPFHWFVEYFGILNDGGFDVIIGNPPYVEYSKVRGQYTVKINYNTLPCGNLYTLILERCYELGRKGAWVSLIVPLSLLCTGRTAEIRELVKHFVVWLSAYDMRPGTLFEGVAQRLTILISRNCKNADGVALVGGYRRWLSEERPTLISKTTYSPIATSQNTKTIAKFSQPIERSILAKISGPPLAQFSDETSKSIVIHRIVRYFVKALSFIPLFVDARGRKGKSEDYKEFRFGSEDRDHITALLNSTLFYWFWRSHCDGFHCGYEDVYSMPYKKLTNSEEAIALKRLLGELMHQLKGNSEERSIKTKAGKIRYQEFYPAASKSILDQIDTVLARHYGFTEEELDFILNYDIKYRMGSNSEVEEDE